MANKTKCLTPNTIFHSKVEGNKVSIEAELPFNLNIDAEEAEIIETLMHNSLEQILRPYFKNSQQNKTLNPKEPFHDMFGPEGYTYQID
jgi:hypothetical protein